MIFSIKAIIRAFAAPNHAVSCRAGYWRRLVGEIERRGGYATEAGAFLLGREVGGRAQVESAVFYDDLDSKAYATGACILHGDAFSKLWSLCRERQQSVLADVHSHPGAGFQSYEDRTNPMVARAGHIALILPDFGRWPIDQSRFGIYEYRGDHEWIDRRPIVAPGFFHTGFWS